MSNEISKGFVEAPRPAMSETAFRRYEKWIAKATKGSYMMEKAMLGETQANSWAVGFNEARRGFLKYGYGNCGVRCIGLLVGSPLVAEFNVQHIGGGVGVRRGLQ